MLKFLKATKRYHNKSENGDIELKHCHPYEYELKQDWLYNKLLVWIRIRIVYRRILFANWICK